MECTPLKICTQSLDFDDHNLLQIKEETSYKVLSIINNV